MFEGAADKSEHLAGHYEAVAELCNSHLFSAGEVIASSDADGIHLDPDQHELLGNAMADAVQRILTSR